MVTSALRSVFRPTGSGAASCRPFNVDAWAGAAHVWIGSAFRVVAHFATLWHNVRHMTNARVVGRVEALLDRAAEAWLRRVMEVFPVVVMMGARQVGKSTLARKIADQDGRPYFSLDDLDVRAVAEADPSGLLARSERLVIDEVQRVPDLLLSIKQAVDMDRPRRPGRFLLTGSANLLLMEGLSESLAGRAGYVTLWPFTRGELLGRGRTGLWNLIVNEPPAAWVDGLEVAGLPRAPWQEVVRRGGYPTPSYELADPEAAGIWFDGYLRTYLERDLQQLASIDGLVDFRRLMRIAGLRVGGLAVQSEMARDADLPHSTARRYLNLLETSFQIVRVEPFAGNRTKRVVKSPKLFWNDTALALRVAGETEPRGAHLENLVLTDLAAWKDTRAGSPQVLYWRTYDGREVDFVIETGSSVVAIEVKATDRPRPRDWAHLVEFRERYGEVMKGGLLLHAGERTEWVSERVLSVPWWRVV
jgi:predicted AAA+ superfamily ATPase